MRKRDISANEKSFKSNPKITSQISGGGQQRAASALTQNLAAAKRIASAAHIGSAQIVGEL